MPETAYNPDPRPSPLQFPPSRGYGQQSISISSDTSLYVDPVLGADTNSGATPGAGAFRTIQAAIDYIADHVFIESGKTLTLSLADGTHNLTSTLTIRDFQGSGAVVIQGNDTTPSNCVLQAGFNSSSIISATREISSTTIRGIKLIGQSNNTGITISNNSILTIRNIEFGANLGAHLLVTPMSILNIQGNLTISGGGTYFIRCEQNSTVFFSVALTVTLVGTPAFSVGFVVCNGASAITCASSAITFSGSATGVRYAASLGGVINTSGGGANYFPGDQAGTTATNGVYA